MTGLPRDILFSLVGVVLTMVSSFLLLMTEPAQRSLRRWLLARGPGPITVGVTTKYESIWAGHPQAWIGQSFYVPRAELSRQPPGTLAEWPDWIRSQGGAAEGELLLLVTLVCDADTTVVVRPPLLDVERKDIGPAATKLMWQPQGGPTIMPTVRFEVRLGLGLSQPDAMDAADGSTPLSWAMTRGDAQQFLIRAIPDWPGVYSWSLRLPLVVGGREVIRKVDDDGSPFQTAKVPESQAAFFWAGGDWHEPVPPHFA